MGRFDVAPYAIGEWVRLNSGGPKMLVVDIKPISQRITVAWRSRHPTETHEEELPWACVTPAR